MKKQVTLLAGLLLVAGVANAQKTTLPTRSKTVPTPSLYSGKISSEAGLIEKAAGDVLWSNNFNSATNWLSTSVGGTVGTNYGWQIAAAPNAILTWAFPTTGINSTSDGGYAVVENGDPTQTPGTQTPNTEWILTYDSTFNFSTYSDVIFQFEEYGAQFIEKQSVEVSTDGGTIWTEIGNNADLGQYTATGGSAFANPTLRRYNVSDALGGTIPATLKFRFRVTWPANAGTNSGIMYGWFVDDVKFIEGYPNDLRIENAYALTGSWGQSYTRFPASQVNDGGVAETTVTAKVSNVGSAAQDALLTVVNGAYTGTSNETPIAGFSDDSLVVTAAYPIPTTVGVSNFTATVTSNNSTLDNTTDDAKTLKFQVTDNIMAVDAFTGVASSMTGAFTSFVGQATGELTGIGTSFEIFEDGEIGAIEVGIANITGAANQAPYVGKEFYVNWYRFDEGSQTFVYEDETPAKILASNNFGKIVKFYLTNTISVTAGEILLVVATSYVDSEVPFAFSGVIPAGGTMGVAGTIDDVIGLASDEATPTVVEAPVVRLDFQSYVGMDEMENVAGVSAFPNPFSDATDISFELKGDAAVSIVVTDLAGRVVLNIPAANYTAGTHEVSIDGTVMSAGVYNCTLTAGNNTVTKRIVKK